MTNVLAVVRRHGHMYGTRRLMRIPSSTSSCSGQSDNVCATQMSNQLEDDTTNNDINASPSNHHSENKTAEQATAALVRRTLCAHHLQRAAFAGVDGARVDARALDELLPPLTSSNEVDLQLYAFLAILVKELVQPWYTRFTSDHDFVDEVIQIVAHCTRALEQRTREIDLELLCLEEIPRLLESHLDAWRTAVKASSAATAKSSARSIYHSTRPHPALDPVGDNYQASQEQEKHEAAYRHLVAQGVSAVLLPNEDLQNPCLRVLVSETLGDLVLGNIVAGKLCESSFIYESISKGADVIQTRLRLVPWVHPLEVSISDKARTEKELGHDDGANFNKGESATIKSLFSQGLHCIYAVFACLQLLLVAVATSTDAPKRRAVGAFTANEQLASPKHGLGSKQQGLQRDSSIAPKPILSCEIWPTFAKLVQLPRRMPWTYGCLSLASWMLLQGPGSLGKTNGRLDSGFKRTCQEAELAELDDIRNLNPERLLVQCIHMSFRDPSLLPTILSSLRTSIFPNNSLTKPPQGALHDVAQDEQSRKSRRVAAIAILNCLPQFVARAYFGAGTRSDGDSVTPETMIGEVEELLSVFDDPYLNKHLMYSVLECVIAKLLPEMADRGEPFDQGKGVKDLIQARGISLEDAP